MDWADGFLAQFGGRKSLAPSNLVVPVQIQSQITRVPQVVEKRGGSGRKSDEDVFDAVMTQPFSQIDWRCKSSCAYGRNCHEKPGFLPFVVGLRKSFWGKFGQDPPTSGERLLRAEKIMKGFQITTPQGESSFRYSYACKADSAKIVDIPICEHVYFVALGGGGKTKMWYTIQHKLCNESKGVTPNRDTKETETQRAAFKAAKVRAFIRLFLQGCDRPPTKGMTNMYILPFPSVEQFYNEYLASFKASNLAALGNIEVVTKTIESQASLTTFREVFSQDFANTCKFMRNRGNHTSCEVCINAATLLGDQGRHWPLAAEEVSPNTI
jgi:hypothetical protein